MGARSLMRAERWLPVVGYEGRYEVSDLGRVRVLVASPRGPRRPAGRLLPPWIGTNDYRKVALSHGTRDQKAVNVHTMVLEAFVRPRPQGLVCRHLDGDPSNNTLPENCADTRRHGRSVYGDCHPSSTISSADVREIRRRAAAGENQTAIARDYGITSRHVSGIHTRRSWSSVA